MSQKGSKSTRWPTRTLATHLQLRHRQSPLTLATTNLHPPSPPTANKVVSVDGCVDFNAATQQCRIDLKTTLPAGLGQSGIVLSGERRGYALSDDGLTLQLDENRFGSRRRTTITSIKFDKKTDSVTVAGEWRGLWRAIPFSVPLSASEGGEAAGAVEVETTSDDEDTDAPR